MRFSPFSSLAVPVLALCVAGTAFAQQALATSEPKAVPVFKDGQAQVVFAFQDTTKWIRQTVWVETEFDSDHDGKRDRMYVDVTRQGQTATEGLKVPVIYHSSPYFGGSNRKATLAYSNAMGTKWLPRGFAFVRSEAPGTGMSQGCPTMGDLSEGLAGKAVVDWLNGRARAFTTSNGTDTVNATSWSTGKVGMMGTSYDGTLTLATATTGVEGLKAIVPVAPVVSWYWYYRSNGLVRPPNPGGLGSLGGSMDIDKLYDFIHTSDYRRDYCNKTYHDEILMPGKDSTTGDYNDFWAKRNLLDRANNIKAAMLMAHGFNDWNVMPEHSIRMYELLKKRNIPVQLYYYQGGHGGDPPMEQLNRWFTRFLYDIQNGVEDEPRSRIVRERDMPDKPTTYKDYPHPNSVPVTLYPNTGGRTFGSLQFTAGKGQASEQLIDDALQSAPTLARAAESPNRLLYATDTLTEPLHLSGWSKVRIRLSSDKPTATLSVWLIALPWGRGSLITRGWMDLQNYKSLSKGELLVPGKFYDVTFDLQPDDQIIPAGSRLALLIFSSDREFIRMPEANPTLTVDLNATSITIPIVGGEDALKKALKKK